MSKTNKQDALQKTLEKAIQTKNKEKIINLVRNQSLDINERDVSHGLLTILMKICHLEMPDRDIVEILNEILERDPDLNTQDSLGRTAIMHACIAGKPEVADCLISDPDSRIEIFDFDGNSALMHAVKSGSVNISKRILEHPGGLALMDVYNSNGLTPLKYAEKEADPKLYKLLSSYQSNFSNSQNGDMKSNKANRNLALPPAYSPKQQRHRTNHVTPGHTPENPNRSVGGVSPKSIYIDDESHPLYLSTPKLKRKNFRSSEAILLGRSPDVNLPNIQADTGSIENFSDYQNSPSSLKRKGRRNSLSLPDLRGMPGYLVASGDNTPAYQSSSEGYSSEDDDCFMKPSQSPRKPFNRQVRKCVTEEHISFPQIESPKNKTLQRAMTEQCVFKKKGGGRSKKIHIPSSLI